jgi:hypothetical protein
MKNMLVIRYFNWLGTTEQLEEFTSAMKKAVKKTPGTKYLGRFGAMNHNWHFASVTEVKDWETWAEFIKNVDYQRDYKTMPNFVIEFLV